MTENPQDERLVDKRTPGYAAHAHPDDAQPVVSEPIEADLQPRPEPVLDAGKLAGLVSATVVAIGGVIALIAAGQYADLNALGASVGAAVAAVMTLVAYIAPVWQARKARAKVTPLADPRDIQGRKLVARKG